MFDNTAFMFSGQGSQCVGMRRILGRLNQEQTAVFAQADEALDFPVSRLMDEGPAEQLTLTSNAQPALLVVGLAAASSAENLGHRAEVVMGHSLGEYTALVYSGSISFLDGLRLVRRRGLLMQEAVEKTPGRMAAVICRDRERLQEIVADCSRRGVLEITNFNAPQQVVLSGENHTIDQAMEQINSLRVGRAVPLNVSAPFHSSLMKPMADEFASFLQDIEIHPPSSTFIDNVTGEVEADPEKIRRKLVQQLTRPVLWEKSVCTAAGLGITTFVECGPGSVLCGLARRAARGVTVLPAEQLLSSED